MKAPTIFSTVLLAIVASACGGDDASPSPDAGGADGVHPRFDPAPDPMPFGAIPWPDDLYLGAAGGIDVGLLPGESVTPSPQYYDALRLTLADLSGFSTVSPVFFTFDGAIDGSSLPTSPGESLEEGAAVFIVDVDSGSPDAYSRVPVRVDYELGTDVETGSTLPQLAIRPDDGHPLVAGRRYAAVLTRGVRGADGAPLAADPDFATVRDATSRPSDPILAEAYDHYAPVLDGLASHGVPREEVVGLAVFRVQAITEDLRDARARVRELPAPIVTVEEVLAAGAELDARLGIPAADLPGLDVEGGVAHDSIGFLVHGRFESPWLLSDAAHVHGRFARDADGSLRIGRLDSVPFTLILPRSGDLGALRTVVFQHGLGGERSDVMAFADALAGAGYAVIAIDAPFHGLRADRAEADTRNRFTGDETPDGFGDVTGSSVVRDFAGILDARGELVAFHPVYFSDTLRQAVVDLFTVVRAIREPSAWASVRTASASLEGLAFSSEPIAFVGNSLGGMIGTMFTAIEPDVGAAVLAVTGGYIMRVLSDSPPFNQAYLPQLLPILGVDTDDIDYDDYHPIYRPEVAILQTLLDRGDPINYGRTLRGRRIDLLMFMAEHDETLNNLATESLARTVGAPMVGAEPVYTTLETTTAPVRDNVTVEGQMLTRALYVHAPATHGLLFSRTDESRWAHPVRPPFEAVTPTVVSNPIDGAVGQMLHFFESFRSGAAEIAAP